jgi:hypothetical protein
MTGAIRNAIAAGVLLGSAILSAPCVKAEPSLAIMLDEKLQAGHTEELQRELEQRLKQAPFDDEIRFALGVTQFLRAVERLSQAMYRYGLEPPPQYARNFPFFRLPVPHNPGPEQLDYEKMRSVFKAFLGDLAAAEATLAELGSKEIKLPLAIGRIRLDLNSDSVASSEEALWRVFNAWLGGSISSDTADKFVITFDRGDAAWLRGYTHLLSALSEFLLAYDWKQGFDTSFHGFFPQAHLPNAILNDYAPPQNEWFDPGPTADLIAFVHLAHWPVTEPQRMKAALTHLEAAIALSRESWRFILAEADDEAEWIPSPAQKNGAIPRATTTQSQVDGWKAFLNEFEALLKGEKLIPHWRLKKGINLRRVFTEPAAFDPILWAQGSAALPYAEDGPMTTADTWQGIMWMFEGNFFAYAVWFN